MIMIVWQNERSEPNTSDGDSAVLAFLLIVMFGETFFMLIAMFGETFIHVVNFH